VVNVRSGPSRAITHKITNGLVAQNVTLAPAAGDRPILAGNGHLLVISEFRKKAHVPDVLRCQCFVECGDISKPHVLIGPHEDTSLRHRRRRIMQRRQQFG